MSQIDPTAQELAQAVDIAAEIFNKERAAYAMIGGLAVGIRGLIRSTRDADFIVQVPQLRLPGVLEAFAARGFEIDVNKAIQAWNHDHLLAFFRHTVRIDWLKPILPAFQRILDRAKWEDIGSRPIRVADAEGLLLLKLTAFRVRDQEDIKGILAANAGKLDLDWVRQEWQALADKDDPRSAQFEQLVSEFYNEPTAEQ